jgi:hypothetical protein
VAAFSLFAMLNTLDGWYDARGRIRPGDLVAELERLYLGGLAARDGRAPAPHPRLLRGTPQQGGCS